MNAKIKIQVSAKMGSQDMPIGWLVVLYVPSTARSLETAPLFTVPCN